MPERKITRIGIKYGKLVFVWENEVDQLVPIDEIKSLPFPDCAKNCGMIKELGAGECESVCPQKFNSDGKPKQLTSGGINIYV